MRMAVLSGATLIGGRGLALPETGQVDSPEPQDDLRSENPERTAMPLVIN